MLDTNILSYFLKGMQPGLTARMAQTLRTQDSAISAITRAEMRYGQALMAADDKRRRGIDLLLGQLPTLPWTAAAADRYGDIQSQFKKQGTPIGEMDTQIAAHALAENLVLVTHNTRHFERVPGLRLEDWMR
ncbi:MAG: type II toxin-antitoxin system VapC family toxin [Ferruginibacter sp.]|nr:type II toxin-antitoxin system VapC family toxin [Rhodoferax sp.]